ncbi:MAG: exosortase system-associated protein, TIGR04073 family [Candidatus Omnitrophica bacterium]|nr:exosortase system-associated protein, TIGR04073 family [Candidatus Omnitrophota bacterium]
MKGLMAYLLAGLVLMSLSVAATAQSGVAGTCNTQAENKGNNGLDDTSCKAVKVLNKAGFGWTELPKSVIGGMMEENPIKGVIVGIFKGTVNTLNRTASGVSDLVTFPVGEYEKPRVFPAISSSK